MIARAAAAGILALLGSAIAQAQDAPRFCPNSPSLESSACTTEPGRVHVEITAADWQLQRDDATRTDTILAADMLVRLGIGAATELQLDWTPYGTVRTRDRATGAIDRAGRVGDVTLALRRNLRNPDGSGLSYGVQPFVTLPVGRQPVGAGTWSAGVILPLTYDLTKAVNIGVTAEVDAAADADGGGRHFAASFVGAAAIGITDALDVTLEAQIARDDDPSGATTQAVAGLGALFKFAPTRALFAETVVGLNRTAPDVRIYGGVAFLL